MRGLGEYPVPGILQTADTFFQLSTSSSVPPHASSTSNSSIERMSYEVWVLTGSGDSSLVLTGSGDSSSRPDLSINPLNLQHNVSFLNRSF